MKCPTCSNKAVLTVRTTSTNNTIVMIKCDGCNRRVTRTGRKEDSMKIRKLVFDTWDSEIDETYNG